jgi:hypothetical protein
MISALMAITIFKLTLKGNGIFKGEGREEFVIIGY